MAIQLLLVVHVLLLVIWLGVDVGVFYGSFVVLRPGLTGEARITVRRMMAALDLGPRFAMVLQIPVGAAISYALGLSFVFVIPSLAWSLLGLLVLLTLLWVTAIWYEHCVRGLPQGKNFRHWYVPLDWFARIVIGLFALGAGATSLLGLGPLTGTRVPLKVLIFGLIVFASLLIRLSARVYPPLLRELVDEGESAERIAAASRAMRPVRATVLAVWACLVLIVIVSFAVPV